MTRLKVILHYNSVCHLIKTSSWKREVSVKPSPDQSYMILMSSLKHLEWLQKLQYLNKWVCPFSSLVLLSKAYCRSHLLVDGHTLRISSSWPHVCREAVFSPIKVSLCLTEGPHLTAIRKGKQVTYTSLLVAWNLCFRARESSALGSVAEARFIHLCKNWTKNCSYWRLLLYEWRPISYQETK